jgi:hypothetical protein
VIQHHDATSQRQRRKNALLSLSPSISDAFPLVTGLRLGISRGSNPYAMGVRDHKRPDLAQQEREMAQEWQHAWDQAHINR